jgi:uncharacterized membrane protein YgcG
VIWGLEARHYWVAPSLAATAAAQSIDLILARAESTIREYVLSLSPLFYWPLNAEGAVDQTANGRDGSGQGGISFGGGPSLTADPLDSSTTFDGINDAITNAYALASQNYELVALADKPDAQARALLGGSPATGVAFNAAHVALFDRALTAAERAVFESYALDGQIVALGRRSDDSGTASFPRFKLNRIGGLASGGESGDRRDTRVRAQGEIPRRSFRGGKTITYEGLLQARSRRELREVEAQFRAAFDDQINEGLVLVVPHPLYDASGDYRYFPAKALTCDIADEIAFSPGRPGTRGHETPCVVALRNARAGGVSYFDQDGNGYA